jgi:hypothetical protein
MPLRWGNLFNCKFASVRHASGALSGLMEEWFFARCP